MKVRRTLVNISTKIVNLRSKNYFCTARKREWRHLAWRFDPDEYSNPSDFPVTQARRWLVIILTNLVLCWTGTLLGNPGFGSRPTYYHIRRQLEAEA